jgi:hypothetical protein
MNYEKKYKLKQEKYKHELDLADSQAVKIFGNLIGDNLHQYSSRISPVDGECLIACLGVVSPLNSKILCFMVKGQSLLRKNDTLYQIKIYVNNTSQPSDGIPLSVLRLKHPNDNPEKLVIFMEKLRKNFLSSDTYRDILKEKLAIENRKIEAYIDELP